MEKFESKNCKQCKEYFTTKYSEQEFCCKECKHIFNLETQRYRNQISEEKKLDMQLNRMVKMLDKVAPLPKKQKPKLENIPENMRF